MSGCDIDNDFVQRTFAALSAAGDATADVRLSQAATQLPFENNRFHAVYSNGVFEHCAQMPSLIAEVRRVLIPGGIFLIAFPLRCVIVEQHLWLPLVHWFSKGPMQRLLIRTTRPLCNPEARWRSCQSIEQYLQNDVFYWTSQQVRQVINQNFENTTSLAKDYLRAFKKQGDRHSLLRLLLAATTVAPLSWIIEQLILFQWTYIIEASDPIKK